MDRPGQEDGGPNLPFAMAGPYGTLGDSYVELSSDRGAGGCSWHCRQLSMQCADTQMGKLKDQLGLSNGSLA